MTRKWGPKVPNHLSKPWLIEVYRSGEVVFRHRTTPRPDGVLPVFSVDTKKEAEHIQVGMCVLSRVDNETYRLNPRFRNDKELLDLEDMESITGYIRSEMNRVARREPLQKALPR